MAKLYDSANPSGTTWNKQTQKLAVAPGICAGMTAVWCLKMSMGLPAAQTQPGKDESTYLQFVYDLHSTNAKGLIEEFLPRARLVWENKSCWTGNGRGQIAAIGKEGNGHTYFWGYPGHAIGAARRDRDYYLFDPDYGLCEFLSVGDFCAHMEARYKKQLDDENADWTMFMVSYDPQYRTNTRYRGTEKA